MKIHKITLMITDFDNVGADGIKEVIEFQKYPNHCISPSVVNIETEEVEWSDEHPLNHKGWQTEFYRMFARNN